MYDFITDEGTRVIDEEAIEARTRTAKVRPARGAFGDWNQYDAEGEPTITVIGSTQTFSELDDLTENWKPYVTQTEQRMNERGDDMEYDPTSYAWFSRKGDKVQMRTESYAPTVEKAFGSLPGYHRVADGTIQCYYCAYTFNAQWFCKQDNEVSRNLMEHFAVQAMLHTIECKAEHNGLPLIRMVGYDGKPRHWRVAGSMAS